EGYYSALEIADSIKKSYSILFKSSLKMNNKTLNNYSFITDDTFVKNELSKKFMGIKEIEINDLMFELYSLFCIGDYKDLWIEHVYDRGNNKLYINAEYNPIVKSINVKGVTKLNLGFVDSLFSALKNKPYNSKLLNKKLLTLLQTYRSAGYSLAEISSVGFNNNTNEIFVNAKEGKIDKIILEGNNQTNDDIILREFVIKEGDDFVYNKIEKGLIGLRSSNFFDDIDVSVFKDDTLNILKIKVIERNPAVLRFGLKIDNENQTQISLDMRDENVYGTGTEIGAMFFGGIRNRSFVGEYKANRLFKTFFTYKLKAYYDLTDINLYKDDTTKSKNRFKRIKDSEYRQILKGISLGVGTQAGKLGNFIIEGRYETNEIKNKVDYQGSTFKIDIVTLKLDLTIDTQDRFPYPKSGFYVKTYYETAQKNFGSDIGYTKFYNNYSTTFTLYNAHTISNRFILGFADETLPLSQQYTLGGQNSFFGYRENEFRGRQIMVTSLEYRYFLPFKLFFDTYFKIRYDLGSIWASKQEIRFKDLKHGIGTTLSMDTPIGPADFSVGRSFYLRQSSVKNIISWGEVFFYFNIGFAY
nr:BamA/TamA family outer membrane protein [Melioribacteraceae bacterium]